MKKRRTLLIVQQGFCGLAIRRGRTADLFTCPANRGRLRRLVAVGASIRPRPEAGAPLSAGASPVVAGGGQPLTTLARQSSQGSHAPTSRSIPW